MTNITPIAQAVIALVFIAISTFIIPLIKKHTDAATINKILDYIRIFVEAAEQIFPRMCGDDKKQFVKEKLAALGIDVDLDIIDSAIESEVLKLHNELYQYEDVEYEDVEE